MSDLAKLAVGGKLNQKILLEKGIIEKILEEVKVLSNGEIREAVALEGIPVSAGAKAKIEKAGGSIK